MAFEAEIAAVAVAVANPGMDVETPLQAIVDGITAGVGGRTTEVIVTPELAGGGQHTGTVTLGGFYTVLRVETDSDARIRLYATEANRDADLDRDPWVPPLIENDHGLMLDVVLDWPYELTMTPPVPCASFPGPSVAFTIDNLLLEDPAVITISIISLRSE